MVWKLMFLLIVMMVLRSVGMNAPEQKTTGDLLYVVSYDNDFNTIYRYSPATGKSVEVAKIRNDLYSDPGWSPDGRYLYVIEQTSRSYGTLTLIDTVDNSERVLTRTLPQNPCTTRLSWSPDHHRMVYLSIEDSGMVANILSLIDGSLIPLPYSDNNGLSAKAWSSDSRYFAYASRRAQQPVSIYDLETGKDVLRFNADWSLQIHWLGLSNWIAYAGGRHGGGIYVADVTQGTAPQHYTGDYIASISPDGRYILGGDLIDKEMRSASLIDTQAQIQQPIGGTYYGVGSGWSYDGRYFLIGNPSISVYRTADGTQQVLNDESGFPVEASWSPSGHVIALGYWDKPFEDVYGFIEIYDLDAQKSNLVSLPPSFEGGRALNWSPDGAYLAAQADDWEDNPFGGVFLYERATRRITWLSDVYSGAYWSRDSRYLAIFEPGDDIIRVLDMTSMKETVVQESAKGYMYVIGWQGSNEKNDGFYSGC